MCGAVPGLQWGPREQGSPFSAPSKGSSALCSEGNLHAQAYDHLRGAVPHAPERGLQGISSKLYRLHPNNPEACPSFPHDNSTKPSPSLPFLHVIRGKNMPLVFQPLCPPPLPYFLPHLEGLPVTCGASFLTSLHSQPPPLWCPPHMCPWNLEIVFQQPAMLLSIPSFLRRFPQWRSKFYLSRLF